MDKPARGKGGGGKKKRPGLTFLRLGSDALWKRKKEGGEENYLINRPWLPPKEGKKKGLSFCKGEKRGGGEKRRR